MKGQQTHGTSEWRGEKQPYPSEYIGWASPDKEERPEEKKGKERRLASPEAAGANVAAVRLM